MVSLGVGYKIMASFGLVIFFLIDGMVRGNIAPSAATPRAGLVAGLVLVWLAWLWRSGVHVPAITALMIGVFGAMAISEAYHRPTGGGIGTWLLYAGLLWGQYVTRRDWISDFAMVGVVVATIVLVAALTAGYPPGGAFNRNMVAAFLAVLAPSVWVRWKWPVAIVVLAIVMTGSRGAVLALCVAGLVVAWDRLGRIRPMVLTLPAMAGGLALIRPATVGARALCMIEVIKQWWSNGALFGLGPNFSMVLSWGEMADNAHSVPPTLLAQTGVVGMVVICLAIICLARSQKFERWQLATLAAFATLSIFENVTAWWPVGIVSALSAGASWKLD